MPPLDRALARALVWLLAGLAGSVPLLALSRPEDPTAWFLVHLSVLVAYGLGLAWWLAPLARADHWFPGLGRSRAFASIAALVIVDTGVVALVGLTSAAALRFQPSLQFLQLLSVLDIAWAGAAISIAAFVLWGRRAAIASGLALGVFCVYSIWRYVDIVGLGPDGEWIVDGRELMVNVIPFDMVAAVVAITLTVLAARALQLTEQARVQS